MSSFNLSGTLNIFRLLINPSLSLPHSTIPNFSHLPTALSSAFPPRSGEKPPDIRAVVLDKDNCFAAPNTNHIDPSCRAAFAALRQAFPGDRLLIVSNSAGVTRTPAGEDDAKTLEAETGVAVLRHAVKKPGCGEEIMRFFAARPETGVRHAGHVAVVGDRIFTDVVMANMMGARAVWVRDGVVEEKGRVCLVSVVDQRTSSNFVSRSLVLRKGSSTSSLHANLNLRHRVVTLSDVLVFDSAPDSTDKTLSF